MDRAAEIEDATDELLTLLLDDLAPALQWYRDEVARRLGLSLRELLCLDLCLRRGPITSGRIGEQLGLTRSAVGKLLRRLEADGHVVREIPHGNDQGDRGPATALAERRAARAAQDARPWWTR